MDANNQNKTQKRTVYLEDLIGSRIVDANGKKLGRVVEMKLTPHQPYRVTHLLFGTGGWLDRMAVLPPFGKIFGEPDEPCSVEWEGVDSFQGYVVKLKPGYEPSRQP